VDESTIQRDSTTPAGQDSRPAVRLLRARASLEGLSVGDAFGERFFVDPAVVDSLIEEQALPTPPWLYTDDTEMALSVYAVLRQHGRIDQDALARSFATRYDPSRGYGPAIHRLLRGIGGGASWADAARALFEGQGSFGNGAAMRVAPVGAYFADDLHEAAEEAARSAAVTHAHPEGIVGAVAVALAAAWAWRLRNDPAPSPADFIDLILGALPPGDVHSRVRRARDLSPAAPLQTAVGVLGNGSLISAKYTVPFCLWCVSRHLREYVNALWLTVSGLGDRDTTCAIVGGIIAAGTGVDAIPAAWRTAREPLPSWAL
jgi:ADP-ribosylglycohydrolase